MVALDSDGTINDRDEEKFCVIRGCKRKRQDANSGRRKNNSKRISGFIEMKFETFMHRHGSDYITT